MADTTIVFYGIRLEVSDDEIESLEDRTHPALLNAKKAGLQHQWGNFGAPGERYLLFIGKALAKLGDEESAEVQINEVVFATLAADVTNRLIGAGFSSEAPLLYM